jgi:iron complex transport system substrate-binding protein
MTSGKLDHMAGRCRGCKTQVPSRAVLALCLGIVALWCVGTLGCQPLRAAGAAKPSRIVSLDLCTDQILIELVDRSRIAAVTHLASDAAVSAIAEKAQGIRITRGEAEDVLRLDADLILAGPYGVRASVDLLRRLGKPVVVVPQSQDLAGVRAAVLAVAAAVGAEAEGQALITGFDHRLARLPATRQGGVRPTAILYQIGGLASGAGSLAQDALAAAGLRNKTAEYHLTRGGQVPMEMLLAEPPDLLVLSSGAAQYRTALADNLRHPVLRYLRAKHMSIELPWRLGLCGTPHIMDAVEQLAAARVRLEASAR